MAQIRLPPFPFLSSRKWIWSRRWKDQTNMTGIKKPQAAAQPTKGLAQLYKTFD